MLVSQFVDGGSAEFSLVRNGNQLTATFHYDLTGFEDEEGIFHWDGEIGASIGAYSDYFQQTNDRPMDLQFVATLVSGMNTAASYFVNDNIGGASFDHEFNVVIFSTAANFVGSSAADLVFGSAGADEFRSNGPGDMFEGGAGNDLYRIYNSDTKVFETAGGGEDRIASGVSYVLAAGVAVEQMTTNGSTGTAKINLTGNALAQTITGNAGDNKLRDGGGAGDVLVGLDGNDTYRIYSSATTIQEFAGQGGADRIAAGVNYTLAAGVDIEIIATNGLSGTTKINLTGNELDQKIYGNAGANLLDGGTGDDILIGGAGADFLHGGVNSLGDENYASYENATAGVVADLFNPSNNKGDAAGDTYKYIDNLIGSAFNDVLKGQKVMIGGAGADVISAGTAYNPATSYVTATTGVVVNLADPSVNTGDAAGDTFININNIIGTAFDDTLTGDEGYNGIWGGAGDDYLYGGNDTDSSRSNNLYGEAGYDHLFGSVFTDVLDLGLDGGYAAGGKGNDFYIIPGLATDVVVELAGEGSDQLMVGRSYQLGAGIEIERIQTTNSSSTRAINLTGNEFGQVINGNAGANKLAGGGGNDELHGIGGNDILTGGIGSDIFFIETARNATTNVETITDFTSGVDRIFIQNAVFVGMPTSNQLSASAFAANTTGLAEDASDRIIYDTGTGKLYHDPDGLGGAAGVQFAVLTGAPTLTFADFAVI